MKWILHLLFILNSTCSLLATNGDYPSTANLSSSWISNFTEFWSFKDGSNLKPVLMNNSNMSFPAVGCGFYGNGTFDSIYFVIFAARSTSDSMLMYSGSPKILWSANRANPVKLNSTLHLTANGDLVLRDANGSLAWSTNTPGKSVVGMNISLSGNLVLFDSNSSVVWQSFDHPADVWLPGQKLYPGQRLTASVSATNCTAGQFYLSCTDDGLFAFVEADPPQMYGTIVFVEGINLSTKFIIYGRLDIVPGGDRSNSIAVLYVSSTESFQYIRLDSDGILRVYQWIYGVEELADDGLLDGNLGGCANPTACGNYGICASPTSVGERCSCPKGNYFRQLSSEEPSLGCVEVTPLSCQSPHLHLLLQLHGVSYFELEMHIANMDLESCLHACRINCSCKAAMYWNSTGLSSNEGNCTMLSQVFSLTQQEFSVDYEYSSTFIKVQKPSVAQSPNSAPKSESPPPSSKKSTLRIGLIIGPIVAASLVLFTFLIWIYVRADKKKPSAAESTPNSPTRSETSPARNKTNWIALIMGPIMATCLMPFICIVWIYVKVNQKIRKCSPEEQAEDGEEGVNSLELLPDLPKRYSYQDLMSATENFGISKRIGGGGFGSVFAGILEDGTTIAVKRLDRLGQGRKEFLAEVRTMGSVNHVNLVKLMGFCAERSHRLLVYEYMINGSLDKWIFKKTPETALEWEIRKKIIFNVAKGLAYLHNECQKRIFHLDIKPQNILLDDNLNAKLSDFGLAKLIGRDQSLVMTKIRGTRGYMAPEWLSRKITAKADVYSFGVVMLEVVCGRKNLDYSQPEENEHLLQILKEKAEANQLLELVDKCSEDMQRNGEAAVEMIRIAIWCLHSNPARRPTMCTVVKVLEGSAVVERVSDYSFLNEAVADASTAPPASILSGPR